MKRASIWIATIFVVAIFISGVVVAKSNHKHRQTLTSHVWGASSQAILASDPTNVIIRTPHALVRRDHLFGYEFVSFYDFIDNHLNSEYLVLNEKFDHIGTYIEAFNKIKRHLVKKYGIPDKHDEMMLHDINTIAHKVAMGEMSLLAHWHPKDGRLGLQIRVAKGELGQIEVRIRNFPPSAKYQIQNNRVNI